MNGAEKALTGSLISDTGDSSTLIKYLQDSIPIGEHPNPHSEWVRVRLDVVQEAIDHIEWVEKGVEEWRELFDRSTQRVTQAEALSRVAIAHLQAVLNKARTFDEQQKADAAARDWLLSIGSEPA